jgi:hypothetical protein
MASISITMLFVRNERLSIFRQISGHKSPEETSDHQAVYRYCSRAIRKTNKKLDEKTTLAHFG